MAHIPTLFDSLDDPFDTGWTAPEPPQLCSRGVKHIVLDTETTGLRWWEQDRPIGTAVRPIDGSAVYLPTGHRGGNLDEAVVKRWYAREVRDLHITNINTRFDVHQLREWGVDLERQNVTVSDVSHYAALLDDRRQKFNLEALSQEMLGEGKVQGLDKTRMASYHASQVAAYASQDVDLVAQLSDLMLPKIKTENLERVLALENDLIYPVCSMESAGAPIDHALLEHYITAAKAELDQRMQELTKTFGFQLEPSKRDLMVRAFQKLGLPLTLLASGAPSFTDAVLASHNHPDLYKIRRVNKLRSLLSKYLLKYRKCVDSHGLIRYALHQLRAIRDEQDERAAGTISGRFSSTEITADVGLNIQQEIKAAKQRVAWGYDEDDDTHDADIFLIRALRVPPDGREWLTSDAEQIEYRLFAGEANNPKIIQAYKDDPLASFHRMMHATIKPLQPGVWTYRQQKDLNFANIYGAQLIKTATMLGYITAPEADEIRAHKHWNHPKLAPAKAIKEIFNREIPEVPYLLDKFQHLARPKCDSNCRRGPYSDQLHKQFEHQGRVETILGRRSRFPDAQRLHKALNCFIQGSAADIMKQKIVEVHRAIRSGELDFKMRYTVHDELDGDVPLDDRITARKLKTILNHQSFPDLRVPILWSVDAGPNWAAVKPI